MARCAGVVHVAAFVSGIFCCLSLTMGATPSGGKVFMKAPTSKRLGALKQKYLSDLAANRAQRTPAQQKLSTDLLQLLDRRFVPDGTSAEQVARTMAASKRFIVGQEASGRSKAIR